MGVESILASTIAGSKVVGKILGVNQESPKAPTVKDNREAERKAKASSIRQARARERGRFGVSQSILTRPGATSLAQANTGGTTGGGPGSGFGQLKTRRKTLMGG